MFAQRFFQHYTDQQEIIYRLVSTLQTFINTLKDEIVS